MRDSAVTQGRNEGGQGGTIPRAPITAGAPKSPDNVTSSEIEYICFHKTSGSNIGVPN